MKRFVLLLPLLPLASASRLRHRSGQHIAETIESVTSFGFDGEEMERVEMTITPGSQAKHSVGRRRGRRRGRGHVTMGHPGHGRRLAMTSTSRANTTVVLPIFVKLHKVASSTVATLFNCVHTLHPLLFGDMMHHWKACTKFHTPWSHSLIGDLELHGIPYFAHCGAGDANAPVKLLTIMRRPQDRFISALRYFDQIRKQKVEVRRVMVHPQTVSLGKVSVLISEDPCWH